jgi:hypothetical protein
VRIRSWPLLLTLAACGRDPLEDTCPDVAAGDLVVTEIRGNAEHWVELYNTRGLELDMSGITLRLSTLDGSKVDDIPLREPGTPLLVDTHAYFVAGQGASVDFAWAGVYDGDLHDAAVLEVRSCNVLVDRVIWRNLPDTGSWQLPVVPPTAVANDDESAFCGSPDPAGTPGQENPLCP